MRLVSGAVEGEARWTSIHDAQPEAGLIECSRQGVWGGREYCLIGVVFGTLVGVLPGLGPLGGIALILPITYSFDPTTGLIAMAGIPCGWGEYTADQIRVLLTTAFTGFQAAVLQAVVFGDGQPALSAVLWPLEAAATVDACEAAFLATGDIEAYDFNGIVSFSGSYNGHVMVSMPPQLLRELLLLQRETDLSDRKSVV